MTVDERKAQKALELKIAGMSWDDISVRIGLSDGVEAWRLVEEYLRSDPT